MHEWMYDCTWKNMHRQQGPRSQSVKKTRRHATDRKQPENKHEQNKSDLCGGRLWNELGNKKKTQEKKGPIERPEANRRSSMEKDENRLFRVVMEKMTQKTTTRTTTNTYQGARTTRECHRQTAPNLCCVCVEMYVCVCMCNYGDHYQLCRVRCWPTLRE